MKALVKKFWEEPAAAIGVLTALGFALGEAFLGDGLQSSDLPAIGAILGPAFVTRQLVTPKE